MKLNKDKLKEWMKSRYAKPILFFAFYFIFFAFVFSFLNSAQPGDNTKKPIVDMWDSITTNYEYRYDVTDKDGQVISFEGKKYNNKDLYSKKIDGTFDSEVYTFYDEISIRKYDKWVYTNTDNLVVVSQSFNNRYFDIQYIKKLVMDAELIDTTTNFDDSLSEIYLFGNIELEVISENEVLKRINIVDPLYKINIQYKNINEVKDFVVER